MRPRDDWNFGAFGETAGGRLVAERFEKMRARTDESDAGSLAGTRERGIFGEEAVAGMDRVDALFLGQGDDAIDVEIGLHGSESLADLVGFVGFETMEAQTIFFGVDTDRAQAELSGGAHDADGDFTAVQGEKFLHEEPFSLSGRSGSGLQRNAPVIQLGVSLVWIIP